MRARRATRSDCVHSSTWRLGSAPAFKKLLKLRRQTPNTGGANVMLAGECLKVFAIFVCASLSSCALAGLEGPERQAQAKVALKQLSNALTQSLPSPIDLGDYSPAPDEEYQAQAPVPAQAPLVESHSETGWIGGEPYHAYSTGNVNNGGQMTTGWIGNQPFHTYSTPGLTTGSIGNKPISVIGN